MEENMEKNPLAKLARELGMFADFNRDADRVNGYVITRAKRIVAEIAKVYEPIDRASIKPGPDGRVHFADICNADMERAFDAIRNCRTIADEDVKK